MAFDIPLPVTARAHLFTTITRARAIHHYLPPSDSEHAVAAIMTLHDMYVSQVYYDFVIDAGYFKRRSISIIDACRPCGEFLHATEGRYRAYMPLLITAQYRRPIMPDSYFMSPAGCDSLGIYYHSTGCVFTAAGTCCAAFAITHG